MDGQSGSLILPTASEKITALQEDEKAAELIKKFVPTFVEVSGVSKNAIEQLSVEEIEELDKIVLRNQPKFIMQMVLCNDLIMLGVFGCVTTAFIEPYIEYKHLSLFSGIALILFSTCMLFALANIGVIIQLIQYRRVCKQLRSILRADYGKKLLQAISAHR